MRSVHTTRSQGVAPSRHLVQIGKSRLSFNGLGHRDHKNDRHTYTHTHPDPCPLIFVGMLDLHAITRTFYKVHRQKSFSLSLATSHAKTSTKKPQGHGVPTIGFLETTLRRLFCFDINIILEMKSRRRLTILSPMRFKNPSTMHRIITFIMLWEARNLTSPPSPVLTLEIQ